MADLSLDGIRKSYGPVRVVQGVDLRVAEGEIVCLLGGSGCGKTTTLRMIAGLEEPDEGTLSIGGRVVSGPGVFVPPEERGLGMVFQSYAVWPHLDVLRNVTFPLRRSGAREAERKAREALALVHLDGLESRRPDQLSGGQQQRVALARALVADPAVLLLDEPLSNLDARLRGEVRDEIRALARAKGITTVLVTHDHEEAFAVGDRIAFVHAGRIEQQGPPRELWERPASAAVARFFGVEELPGQAEGDAVVVDGVRVPAVRTSDAPTSGPARLAFRTSDATLGSSGLPGVVTSASFLGSHATCRVRVAGVEVRVTGEAAPGAEVRVHLRRAFVLP